MSELQPQTTPLIASVGLSVAPLSYTSSSSAQRARKQNQAELPRCHLQRAQQQRDEEERKESLWTQWASEIAKPRIPLFSFPIQLLRNLPSQHGLAPTPCHWDHVQEPCEGLDCGGLNKLMLLLCAAARRGQDAEAGAELSSAIPPVSSQDVPGHTA